MHILKVCLNHCTAFINILIFFKNKWHEMIGCVTIRHTPKFEVGSAPMRLLPTVPSMSYLYGADDFDANGDFISTECLLDLLPGNEGMPLNHPHSLSAGSRQFPSFDKVNWDDPSLYTMPLTKEEILALTYDIATTNVQTNVPTYPELPTARLPSPPAHTPSPQPFCPELPPARMSSQSRDEGSPSPTIVSRDEGSPSSTTAEVLDTSKETFRDANTSSWAVQNPMQAIICP
jgi:hypothetical protein